MPAGAEGPSSPEGEAQIWSDLLREVDYSGLPFSSIVLSTFQLHAKINKLLHDSISLLFRNTKAFSLNLKIAFV